MQPSIFQLEKDERRNFNLLQAFRGIAAILLVVFCSELIEVGTSSWWLAFGATLGILLSGSLLKRNFSLLVVTLIHLSLYLLTLLSTLAVDFFAPILFASAAQGDFFTARISDDLYLVGAVYVVSFFANWLFWSYRSLATLEATLGSLLFVWLLSGHRNYNLDAPKQTSSLTWKIEILQSYGVQPQHIILSLAVSFAVLLGFYLALSNDRPLFSSKRAARSMGRKQRIASFFYPASLLALLLTYSYYVNVGYSADLTRTMNGVGQTPDEGDSSLGFHSATTQTKQPSALIRLEGDYERNPSAPMLYLREGALSDFNGREIVRAKAGFDSDTPTTSPGGSYVGNLPEPGPFRDKLVQSVYLLSKHKTAFGIDVVKSYRSIKNPDPDRFLVAYQALSYVPTSKLDSMIGVPVGDPSWDKKTLAHYLRAPGSLSSKEPDLQAWQEENPVLDESGEDLRYRSYAKWLVGQVKEPLTKAALITQYLSKESLYTRNPGHEVSKSEDPVSQYLFSEEKRGYCVHFSHAAVYMLRLSGIPARIGTGYLTDTSYAKDGHILLHLGDRHAWPEMYIYGHGWVVVDITPQNAENEAEIVPDEKLLEELMSKIDPAEEFTEPPPPEDLEGDSDSGVSFGTEGKQSFFYLMGTLLLLFLAAKTWLRFGFLLTSNPEARSRLAYVAYASSAYDLGHGRASGETREELRKRLARELSIDGAKLTSLLEKRSYVKEASVKGDEVSQAIQEWKNSVSKKVPLWKRFLSFFNPATLTSWWRW